MRVVDQPYLEGIRLSEVSGGRKPYGDPHVIDLGGDVAEGQVADEHLLAVIQVQGGTRLIAGPGDLHMNEGAGEGVSERDDLMSGP